MADDAVDRGYARVLETAVSSLRALIARPALLGTAMALPVPLYLVLGTGLGLRWWRIPWPGAVSAGLLWLMVADAALLTVLFVPISALFFLGLWRGKVSIPGDKRPGMVYFYLVTPLQYGLIALWGIAAVTGDHGRGLLETGQALLLVSLVVRPWLKLLQRIEP